MSELLFGFGVAFVWQNMLAMIIGTFLGIIIGALPGLGSTVGLTLLVPVTYAMPSETSIIVLVSLYMAAEYGGSISAILIGTPGTAAAIATIFDGLPLARKGFPGKALGISLTASSIGGILSTLFLIFLSLPLVKFALKFGPPEYFALGLFGLSLVSSLSGKQASKGILMAVMGLLITAVGIDPVSGAARFTFDTPNLFDGIPLIPALLGLYAISEVFYMVESIGDGSGHLNQKGVSSKFLTLKETTSLIPTILRGSIIGTLIGIIPGAGGSIASLVSYDQEKRLAKNKEEFGKGDYRGIGAAESANNATVGGALVPLLTLGIPGSPTTAVLLGALMLHGLIPGPDLFQKNPEVVYGLFAALLLTCVAMFVIGFFASKVFSLTLNISSIILAPIILGLSIIGAYTGRNLMMDVYLALGFGILGYTLRKLDFPIAPMVLAIVLGRIMESNLRRSLLMSYGSYSIFATRPLCVSLMGLAFLCFFLPFYQEWRAKKKHERSKDLPTSK